MNTLGLSTNPHLVGLLEKCELRIDASTEAAHYLSGEELKIGDIVTEGTVIGFAVVDGRLNCVVYDETKEGEDTALSTFLCKQ